MQNSARGPEDDLPFHPEMQQVELFSDISCAPAGERSLQGITAVFMEGRCVPTQNFESEDHPNELKTRDFYGFLKARGDALS